MNTLISVLYLLWRAGVPALLEGVHGIGKTSIAAQLHARIAKELDQEHGHENLTTLDGRDMAHLASVAPDQFGYWACSAANLTIEELIGYPQPTPDGKLRYLRSHNFIPPPDHRGGGIWMIDELNLAFSEVERAVMSLALEGRYLDYVMPKGIFIITSQNPSAGDYQSRRLNPPTLNRFCWIKALASTKDTMSYFMEKGFHSSIIDCIGEHSEKVLNPHQGEVDFSIEQKPTSRSWEYVNKVMEVATPEEIEKLGHIVFTGLLGPTVGSIYMRFAMDRGERSIPVSEVLENYGYNEETYDPDKTTMREGEDGSWPMTKIRRQVIKISRNASVRVDIISNALDELVGHLKRIAEEVKEEYEKDKSVRIIDLMTEKRRRYLLNAIAFLHDLPPDQSGPVFLRNIQGDAYDYGWRHFSRHRIMNDYHDTWEKVAASAHKVGQ